MGRVLVANEKKDIIHMILKDGVVVIETKPNLAPKDAPAIAISGLLLLVTKILADTESGMCELFELDKTPSSENRLDRSNFGEILG